MTTGPKQEPDNSVEESWEEPTAWHLPDKSHGSFEYKESTEENISKPSHGFHYEGNDLPEKE